MIKSRPYLLVKFKPIFRKHSVWMRFWANKKEKNPITKLLRRTIQSTKWQGRFQYAMLKNETGVLLSRYNEKGQEISKEEWKKMLQVVCFKASFISFPNFAKKRLKAGLSRNINMKIVGEKELLGAYLAMKDWWIGSSFEADIMHVKIYDLKTEEQVAQIEHPFSPKISWTSPLSVLSDVLKLEKKAVL